ncbi:MAG TPA: hypothetical protein P5280_02355, partial [Cyclobacteriaceae bacterium]|nr:hypothetical protein [Cyclobacteriaceae bacterium]
MKELLELLQAAGVDHLIAGGPKTSKLKYPDGKEYLPSFGSGILLNYGADDKFRPLMPLRTIQGKTKHVPITIPRVGIDNLPAGIKREMPSFPWAHPYDCALTGAKIIIQKGSAVLDIDSCADQLKLVPAYDLRLTEGGNKVLTFLGVQVATKESTLRCYTGGSTRYNWDVPIGMGPIPVINNGKKVEEQSVVNALSRMSGLPRYMGAYYNMPEEILRMRIELLYGVGLTWAKIR